MNVNPEEKNYSVACFLLLKYSRLAPFADHLRFNITFVAYFTS